MADAAIIQLPSLPYDVSQVVAVLLDVRQRLAEPRAWLKGGWHGRRCSDGRIHVMDHSCGGTVDCYCLGAAISLAVREQTGAVSWTELRSDVERELLSEVDRLRPACANPIRFPAIYLWNDHPATTHGDVIALLDSTIERLRVAA